MMRARPSASRTRSCSFAGKDGLVPVVPDAADRGGVLHLRGPAAGGAREGFSAGCQPGDLPVGVPVGTAAVARCTRENGHYRWHLTRVKRLPALVVCHPDVGSD